MKITIMIMDLLMMEDLVEVIILLEDLEVLQRLAAVLLLRTSMAHNNMVMIQQQMLRTVMVHRIIQIRAWISLGLHMMITVAQMVTQT